VADFVAPVPPTDEQTRILGYIRDETMKLGKALKRAAHQTTLLREYRTRLIADVVTGKLDVREAAANLPHEAEEPEPLDEREAAENGEETIDEGEIEEAEA